MPGAPPVGAAQGHIDVKTLDEMRRARWVRMPLVSPIKLTRAGGPRQVRGEIGADERGASIAEVEVNPLDAARDRLRVANRAKEQAAARLREAMAALGRSSS
jgi:hypothetical protein